MRHKNRDVKGMPGDAVPSMNKVLLLQQKIKTKNKKT